ncbi:MAG: phosphate acetyltransferase [Mailhella sp.]|nr:phosphate acetyltransferase [Mailhella sp.]
MARTLYVTALAADGSKAEACAALMQVIKAAAKAPVAFKAVPCLDTARSLINAGKGNELVDSVLGAYKAAAADADFVLCEGTDFAGRNASFEVALNAGIVTNLGAPVVLALSGAGCSVAEVTATVKAYCCQMKEQCVSVLGAFLTGMSAEDEAAVNAAFEFPVSSKGADFAAILDACEAHITPRLFEFGLIEQAQKHPMRIVLPEGEEDRLINAAAILLQRKVAKIILLGDPAKIKARAAEMGVNVDDAEIINPVDSADFEDFSATYAELRAKKGVTIEQAREKMADATYYGTMMIYKEKADGMVSGAVNTTAHTVRPALEFIKTKPGASIVSSAFFVCLKDRVNTYGDCAVNLDPDAEQLATIAVTTAETAAAFGLEPRVAMLSYSTGNSGKGPSVDKVKEATRIAKEKAPELALSGPLQYDASVDPVTAKTKLPGDPVAGRASVFIVPDINTGTTLYKAVQRSANAIAIGPVLQGLRKPVNDLSRGCTVPDIVNTVAITAIQAQAEKGLK